MTELKSYKAGTEKTAMMGDLFTHKNIEPETASYHYYLVRSATTVGIM